MDACHRCKQEPDGQEYFHKDISDIFHHHTGLNRGDLPDDNKMNMMNLKDDLNELDSLDPEDSLDDKDFDACVATNISNAQLYKIAGNSIVVNVLEHLLTNLLKGEL